MTRWKRILIVCFGILAMVVAISAVLCWAAYEKWFPFRGWHYIVIHHSASSSGSSQSFHRYHLKRGIPGGLTYHFIIGNGRGAKDGSVVAGHRWTEGEAGVHVTLNAWNYNVFGIGICLVGNLDKGRPTTMQWRSLTETVARLCRDHRISPENIIGHTEVHWYCEFGDIDYSDLYPFNSLPVTPLL